METFFANRVLAVKKKVLAVRAIKMSDVVKQFLSHLSTIMGMAAMPFLCRGVWFLPKLSYHINVSLAINLPIFYLSFCQKNICICINKLGCRHHCLLFADDLEVLP